MSIRHAPPPACPLNTGRAALRPESVQRRRGVLAQLSALILSVAACSSKPKPVPVAQPPAQPPAPSAPPPSLVTLLMEALPSLNPDARDRPSPLQVRVYELSSRAAFDRADFNALYTSDAEALGATLLDKQEFVLAPGGKVKKQWSPPAGAKFIGVLAAFRSLEQSVWRQAVAIQAHEMQEIFVRLEARSMSMAVTLLD